MAQSMLMKQGLEGIFSPEKKFEAEARYGQNIYWVAWAVEILAALIGLTIALATAYDAFRDIPDPDLGHYINAIIGALPFLVIAVIEPTKIPLAGGFYKTRILSWKILILIALIGLTTVTFETMFNGLERNLTNVTRQVVDSENRIQFLSDRLVEKERELEEITSKSTTDIVSGIQDEINQLQKSHITELESLKNSFADQINQQRETKSKFEDRIAASVGQASESTKSQTDGLNDNIKALEGQISELEKAKQNAIENYQKEAELAQEQNNLSAKQTTDLLSSQLTNKQNEIERLKKDNLSQIEVYRTSLKDEERSYQNSIKDIERNLQSKKGAFGISRKHKDEADNQRANAKRASENKKRLIERQENERLERLEADLSILNSELKEIEAEIRAASGISNNSPSSFDPNRVAEIRREFAARINPLTEQISKFQQDIANIIAAESGTTQRERNKLNAQIDRVDQKISDLNDDLQQRINEKTETFEQRKDQLEAQKANRINQIEELKGNDELIENEIKEINQEIDEAKNIKREASYDSQVYRLAALVYGKSDVADVTKDEIKVVSIVWFGSIALIVSTIGTVLALISYILRDPEAFVDRPKLNFSRRIYVLIRLFFRQSIKLINSLISAIIAFTRLILSFAEIFRGLIGIPIQRSFRRLFVSIRKNLNKPRIVEVEKEVEKIVEKEVEKIVEVEKEIEKIVEVEKVVEKVVTTEVPVEIIRKELVYVPLYSTDSGLIDASTELKGAKPKLSDRNSSDQLDPMEENSRNRKSKTSQTSKQTKSD